MSEDQSEEKTDPASERKLRKLRDDGIVATSSLAPNLFGLSVGVSVALLLLPMMIDRLMDGFALVFDNIPDTVTNPNILQHFLLTMHVPIGVVMVAIMVAAIGFKILLHAGFIFSMTHVTPDLGKVNPAKGLKNLFQGKTLTEFAATFVRFCVLSGVAGFLAYVWAPVLMKTDLCVPHCAQEIFWRVARALLIACAVLVVVAIAFDVIVQRAFFMREQRMTKTEIKREQKDIHGQPEIRQERRRLQRDTAQLAGVTGVSAATVYFTAPGRVVALAFDPVKTPLPVVAAKARTQEEANVMMATLQLRGLPGRQDEEIVAACEVMPIGSAVPRSIFMPLAKQLREIF